MAVFTEKRLEKPLLAHASHLFRDVKGDPIFLHESNLGVRLASETGEAVVNPDLMANTLEEGQVNCQQHDAGNTSGCTKGRRP